MTWNKTDKLLDLDDPIYRFLDELGERTRDLPFSELLPGQGKLLSARLYPDADILVWRLAGALCERPDLFPGEGGKGPGLWRRQGRAALWTTLIARLELTLKRARDSYVKEQGELVKEALSIADRIDLQDELFWSSVTDEERRDPEWRRGALQRQLERERVFRPARRQLARRRAMYRPGKGKKAIRKSTATARALSKAELERLFREG